MREFFHGWRRKMGVITLLMACLVAAGWVRSASVADGLSLFFRPIGIAVLSQNGIISFGPSSRSEVVEWFFHDRSGMLIDLECPIPYWSIVIPLTLLSAYLLLSKPRPKR